MLAKKKCDLRPDLIIVMEYFHSNIEDFPLFSRGSKVYKVILALFIFYSLDPPHSVLSSSNQANFNISQSHCM